MARTEASSICRQLFANVFADCFVPFTHTNLSLRAFVCRVEAAF